MKLTPKQLWLSVLLFWVGGDLGTTYYGLSIGLVESNPLPAAMLEHGFSLLILNKLLFTALAFAWYAGVKRYKNEIAVGIPIGLTLLGVVITAWNTHLIVIS